MKTRIFSKWMLVVPFSLLFFSCKKDDPQIEDTGSLDFSSGIYIVNEGPFGSGTGTISFYNRSTKSVTQDIFRKVNDADLGNIVQSMSIHNNKAYIVVNNADKIEVVDPSTFVSKSTITGFTMPRYFLGISATKAYVSQWGTDGINGSIKILNLSTNSISGTISTHKGPERMVKVGNYVYVTCKGGYDTDSVVAIIDVNTDAVLKNVDVGDNPDGIVVDANNNVWTISSTNLCQINSSTNVVDKDFSISAGYYYYLSTNSDKNTIFFYQNGSAYKQSITDNALSNTVLFTRSLYAFDVDPFDNKIYCANQNFVSNAYTYRYTDTGDLVDSFKVGQGANSYLFK